MVVFVTSYALILPAITLEQTAYCGTEEHAHTEDCYEKQLICGYAGAAEVGEGLTESGHVHDDACYAVQQVLVCGLEESDGHVHDESCVQAERILSCTQEHEHTDACYETVETYVCGKTEGEGGHTHGPECYETRSTLVCELPETLPSGAEAAQQTHIHTDECYETVLICQKEEHAHSLACYSNPEADVESSAAWERSLAGVELTGVWADDVLAVAESQLGYRESTANYAVMDDGETTKGITRYGQWYGDPYGDWCAMFVSFCLNYAAIPQTAIPYEADCQRWIDALAAPEWALYREAGAYAPRKGDLVFFNTDDDESAEQVGLVQKLEEACILGYGALPENPDAPALGDTAEGRVQSLTAVVYRDSTLREKL